MPEDLGAVVLCHGPDAQEHVRPLVLELLEQGVAPTQVTIVRNSNASDGPFEAPASGIALIKPGRNLGYAGGMNLGIQDQQDKGRALILLLTMDVRLERGAVARLREGALPATKYGIFGPELRWAGTDRTTWGARWNGLGKVDHIQTRPADGDGDGIVESDSIDGAVMLIRAKVLEDIGPLHDHLFMYFEETEFCLRAKRAGWRVGVVLGAVAEQSSGETRRPGAFNYLMARNGLEFARLVAGWRGVVATLWRDVVQSWRLVKMRFSPKSDERRRRFATVSMAALWLGVLAFIRRRWGPPPNDLPGSGDMTFAR
jgi:GT2 family glycosyltransferase